MIAARPEPSHASIEARYAILAAAMLTLLLQGAFVFIDARMLGSWPNAWVDAAHAAMAGAVLIWAARHRRPSVRACDTVFVLLALPYLVAYWTGEIASARLGLVREPLITHQIFMVGIAVLAPGSLLLAGGIIALAAVSATLLLMVLRARYPLLGLAGEPWITYTFALIAIALLAWRVRWRMIVERNLRARADAEALAQMARMFLAVRDRTNTPLQTLEIGTTLLESKCAAEHRRTIAAMRRAVGRLRELTATLAIADEWRAGSAAPVDLVHEIQNAMARARAAGVES
jgi:hypothetical protein